MALQYQLNTLEGLDESVSKLYIEKDGKFILDVIGHEKPADRDTRNMIPKSRLDQEISKRKEAEKGLQAVCDQMIDDIPEDKRSIIPDLAPSAKIEWISKGVKMGILKEKKAESIDIKRPSNQKLKDFSGMNPIELIEHGLKNPKK